MSIPLAVVLKGGTRTIKDLRDAEDMERRLQNFGFIKGKKVRVAGGDASGMTLMVKGVKITLNQGLVSKIMVED